MQQGAVSGELNHEFSRMLRALYLVREHGAAHLPPGVDPAAAQLLAMLVKSGPRRQTEMAEQTFYDPSTVSRRVGQLVQHGLVERRADPADGRAVRLAATEDGVTLVRRMREVHDGIARTVLRDWPDEDVTALLTLLRRYNDDFDVYRRQATTQGEP